MRKLYLTMGVLCTIAFLALIVSVGLQFQSFNEFNEYGKQWGAIYISLVSELFSAAVFVICTILFLKKFSND